MALRLILVSLVASMGFELPSSHDVESWGRSGRVWVAARVSELSTLSTWQDLAGPEDAAEVEAVEDRVAAIDEAPTSHPEDSRTTPVDDLAFEVVVEGMASNFSEDIATARIETERAEAALAALAEAESLGAEAIARDEDAIPPALEAPVVAEAAPIMAEVVPSVDPEEAPAVEAPLPAPEIVAEEAGPSRFDRLTKAVRLTRSAVEAWASLMDPAGSVDIGEQVVLSR